MSGKIDSEIITDLSLHRLPPSMAEHCIRYNHSWQPSLNCEDTVPDLMWDDVKLLFDPEVNGALPDVVVERTTVEDWQLLLDLVREQGWQYAYSVDGAESTELPSAADMAEAAHARETPELHVRPITDMLLIFRMYQVTSIDFDVDLRELQGQERLDVLMDVFRLIGRRLGKSVLMSAEGSSGHPELGFDVDADRVVLLVNPNDPRM
ncbi:hypothetical protein ABZ907_23360 [Nonomuraea wenchangensis]